MLDLQERTTKPAAPAKLWRNWYRVRERMRVTNRVGVWRRSIWRRTRDLLASRHAS